jgi:tetratricopeptide (TPR) repeat protein/predicted Ser/Thr protein kinase
MMEIMHDRSPDEFHSDPTVPHRPELDPTVASGGSSSGPSEGAGLPESIGRYRILGLIGEGGMGSVYKAEQDSPRRTVALKVIKAGVASGRLLHRFEIEAQILGRLDHPGIATIYEAGTFGEGRGAQPFFAMEFIEGQELLDYADLRRLGTRDRLRLLARIAEAVQHAHQKGVIHRDLKPGNILVTKEGQIKVLDFGVARATDADIQTATMQTDIGQLVGTIPYMSPEQASGNPDDLDTRSDVYALGVIAYELLTGQMPYDLRQKMIHEAVRVIRFDEPTPMSSINRTLRGDVEIIVGKALMKEKTLRYQSASDLAGDIERYLGDEPIEARPPSTWYQLSKFSRRNKALVTGVAAVLVVSVAGALISINFALGEAEQKDIAVRAAEQARVAQEAAEVAQAEAIKRAQELQQVADFQSEQLGQIEVEQMGLQLRDSIVEGASEGTRTALSESLASVNFTNIALGTLEANIFQRTIEAIEIQFADQPLVHAQMLQATAVNLRELGLIDLATGPQERALAIRREELGDDHPDTLVSINEMGIVLRSQGKLSEVEPYWREALEGSRRVLGDDHPTTLTSIDNMGSLLWSQGKLAEAEPYYREALEGSRRVLGDDHPDTLNSIVNMGFLLRFQGKLSEAEPYYRESLEGFRRVLGDEHPSTLISINGMGGLLQSQGKPTEAEPYYRESLDGFRRVLGDDHPNTLGSISNMGALLESQGKLAEAEPYYSESLEGLRRVLGDDHPDTLTSINNMGALLRSQGKLAEAEPYHSEALDGFRRVLGDDHPHTLQIIVNMGALLYAQGKPAEAEAYYREALEGRRRVLGDDHPSTLSNINSVCFLLDQQERWSESEELRRLLVDLARRAEPEDSARLGSALVQLGINLIEQERFADAEPVLRECLEVRQRVLPEGHWLIWTTQSLLGETLAKQSRFEEAEALLVEAAEQIRPPDASLIRRDEAIQRVIDLYTAWHAVDPAGGHDTKAAEWRARLPGGD